MISRSHGTRRTPRGFTLIELLVVIAIIAILAAILFPVFGSVRKNARMSACEANMRAIITGVQQYKEQYRVYPDALFGISIGGGPVERRLAHADFVKDDNAFTCPEAQGVKGIDTTVAPFNRMTGAAAVDRFNRAIQLPRRDTYTMQYIPNNLSGRPELHYNLKWTGWTTFGGTDPERQLAYRNPPDSTVVTWCEHHVDRNADGSIKFGSMIIVGFLNGRVQRIPANQLPAWPAPATPPAASGPWLVNPKP